MTEFNLKTASSKELVAKFNAMTTGKPVERFENRAAGERRVQALLDSAKALARVKELNTAGREAAAEAKLHPKEEKPAVAQETVPVAKPDPVTQLRKPKGQAPKVKKSKAPVANRSLAEAISASWTNDAVAEARKQRTKVEVRKGGNGAWEKFNSTADAFLKLGLPMGACIAFRMQLKAQGAHQVVVSGEDGSSTTYNFVVVKEQQ